MKYEISWDTVPSSSTHPFTNANFDPSITCTTFFIPNGRFDTNSSIPYGSWTMI